MIEDENTDFFLISFQCILMFYSDAEYRETMKQLLLQIVMYNFNVFEVSSGCRN